MASKYIKAENGLENAVIYYDESGKLWLFEGGTRTWRNQNPGNLVVGKYSRKNGMIGKAGGFAVFPDYSSGHQALLDLLINEYGNFDLVKLMKKFAPPHENKTKKYIQFIKKLTGVDEKKLVSKYSAEEFIKLWKAIEKMEGWKVGTITEYSKKGQITKVRKNKKGKIISYLVDGFGWLRKQEAIDLCKKNKIDAVVVKGSKSIYLRSRPNILDDDNLGNKI